MCLGLANGGKQPAEMTVQEAIQILELNRICSPQATQFNNAVVLAKAALEKQIPKKPNFRNGDKKVFADCPFCNETLTYKDKIRANFCKFKHCHDCGQALDWSGNNGKE